MIAIKGKEIPKGCQRCMFFRKHPFGNGLDYSYSCILGAKEFPMPWIKQMEERASDCPLVEIVTCKDCFRGHRGKYSNSPKYCEYMGRITEDDFYCADAESEVEDESSN